jgi:hypothetical protein
VKTSKTKIKVKDSNGYVTEDQNMENVTDPPGLGNKQKSSQQVTTEEKPNGGYQKTIKTNETNAKGTNVSTTDETDVKVDENGNVTTTKTDEKTVDPKGLMNKQVTKKKVKMLNGKVVEEQMQIK